MNQRLTAIHDLREALVLLALVAAVFLSGYLTGHRARQRRPAIDITTELRRKGVL